MEQLKVDPVRTQVTPITSLELTMREVLAGMDDFATGFAYRGAPDSFEILAIEAPDDAPCRADAA